MVGLRIRFLSLVGIGHAMEIYDFAIYFFLIPIISPLFFPADDAVISVLSGYVVFFAGIIFRPLGGIIIGFYGDKYGRKKALLLSILITAGATLCMGLLPVYNDVGIIAPILLLICRILQSFSFGGEFAGGIIYVLEGTDSPHSGKALGILTAFAASGLLLGFTLSAACTSLLDISWNWRLPILFGSVIALVGYYLRCKLKDDYIKQSKELISPHTQKTYRVRGLLKPILCGIALTFLNGGLVYLSSGFLNYYFVEFCNFSSAEAMWINSLGVMSHIFLYLICGVLLDKVGPYKLASLAILGTITLIYPIFFLFTTGQLLYVLLGKILMGFVTASYTLSYYLILATLFTRAKRYFGFALSQGVGQAILGGASPAIVTSLIHWTGNIYIPALYLICISCISFIALLQTLKLTKHPCSVVDYTHSS